MAQTRAASFGGSEFGLRLAGWGDRFFGTRLAILAVVLLLAGCLCSSRADSQTAAPLRDLSLEQLGDVEVTTVSKDPHKVLTTPAAVYVITQEDIRRSGATSIPEALRMAPGVQVARIDGDRWSVSIRGFAGQFSKSLLVLIDGRTVYTPLYAGVYWDVQNVVLEDIERIEVIRGPGGIIWGANAVNGVINIITKSAKDTRGTLARVGGGNVDLGTGAVRYGGAAGGPNGDAFNYRIYGMGATNGPESHLDNDGFDRHRFGQFGFRSDWKVGAKDTFTVQGDVYRSESGERTDIATFTPPREIQLDATSYASGGNVLARWTHDSGNSDVQVQAYFDRTNRQDVALGETRDTFDLDFVQHLRIHEDQELTWGLGARVSPGNFIQTSPGINFLPNKQVDSIYSSFVQYQLPLVRDKLTLTAGTKLEHNNFSGFDYQPSARLLLTPTARQSFWAAATRAVRTPSRVDQDLQFAIYVTTTTLPIFYQITGDPKLKAEQLLGYEAGYRSQINPKLYVDFTAFYNSYDDLQNYGALGLALAVTPLPVHAIIIIPYANGIEGDTHGAEIAPNWKVNNWWEIRGSYSYLQMHLKDKPGFTDVGNLLGPYLGSSPTSMLSVQSLMNLPRHFELDETYRYSTALAAQAVPPDSNVDVRLGWHPKGNLEFSLVGQNLLRPDHVEFGGDAGGLVGIKRSAYAQITWKK